MEREEKGKWYFRPVGVIVLLFLVLGPFGLPLLYKSPHFSRGWKTALTGLVIIYTVYMIIGSFQIARELFLQMKY